MLRLSTGRTGPTLAFAALLTFTGCGAPVGLGSEELSLEYVDGPADHVRGTLIPPFRVWVVDLFGRRATSLDGGTLTLDLLGPDGAVQTSGFATVPLSFGEGTVTPTSSLEAGIGYSVRGRYQNTTVDSPLFSAVEGSDVVLISNPSAGEMGVIVDGANNIGRLQDTPHRSATTAVDVGVLNSGGLTHAVAVFAPDRRPELVGTSWTAGVDTVAINLRDPIVLPVSVWVIAGDFATAKAQVELALPQVDQIWRRERAGVTVGDVTFTDATAFSTQFGFFAIGLGPAFAALQTGVGGDADRFNIYIVSGVRDGAGELVGGFGQFAGTSMAVTDSALASLGPRVLAHQFGHNFGLQDTSGFDFSSNLMTPGVTATALTEGQTFRAHFDRFSALRSLRAPDTFPAASCPPFVESGTCPDLTYSIWSDQEPPAISSSSSR